MSQTRRNVQKIPKKKNKKNEGGEKILKKLNGWGIIKGRVVSCHVNEVVASTILHHHYLYP